MTNVFEGSLIRTFRRLQELIRQMAMAAKAIGNSELEQKFTKCMCFNVAGPATTKLTYNSPTALECLERPHSVVFVGYPSSYFICLLIALLRIHRTYIPEASYSL